VSEADGTLMDFVGLIPIPTTEADWIKRYGWSELTVPPKTSPV